MVLLLVELVAEDDGNKYVGAEVAAASVLCAVMLLWVKFVKAKYALLSAIVVTLSLNANVSLAAKSKSVVFRGHDVKVNSSRLVVINSVMKTQFTTPYKYEFII